MGSSRWRFRLTSLGASLVVSALACGPAAAVNLALLLDLQGEVVDVHYTPGALDRASHLQDRLELLTGEVSTWTGQGPTLQVFVLSREDWKEGGLSGVYGFPARIARRDLALPSWGDERSVRVWQALLGGDLPSMSDAPMRGSPEESASLALCDDIAGPVAAAILLNKAGFTGDRGWVMDVVAHTVALSAQIRNEPTRRAEVRMLWDDLGQVRNRPGLNSDEGRAFVAALQAEAGYYQAATLIHSPKNKPQAKSILKKARKNGNVVTASQLLESYPQLGAWVTAWDEAQRESGRGASK